MSFRKLPSSHTVQIPRKDLDERAELLQGLFDIVDQDDSGSLSIDELRRMMPNAEAFLEMVDTSHDGTISMDEFKIWGNAWLMNRLHRDHISRLNKLIQLARCGKCLHNGTSRVKAQDMFHALDVNGNSTLSLDEITAVLGSDTLHFLGGLGSLLGEKQSIDEAEFSEWSTRNPGDFQKLFSATLDVNKQALFGIMQLISAHAVDAKTNTPEEARAVRAQQLDSILSANQTERDEQQMPTSPYLQRVQELTRVLQSRQKEQQQLRELNHSLRIQQQDQRQHLLTLRQRLHAKHAKQRKEKRAEKERVHMEQERVRVLERAQLPPPIYHSICGVMKSAFGMKPEPTPAKLISLAGTFASLGMAPKEKEGTSYSTLGRERVEYHIQYHMSGGETLNNQLPTTN
jgi:Ca2+-binding EF-hand superfamily protein